MQRWAWVALAVAGVLLGVQLVRDGQPVLGLLSGGVLLLGAWWTCPWRGGRSARHEEVMAMPESDREVVVYWRPGCGYCARLRSAVGDLAERAQWVNIWQDDEGAAFVRSVNDGNETVPTVVMDGQAVTNPDPAVVRERLSASG